MTALSLRQVCSASSILLAFLAFLREKLLTQGTAEIAKKASKISKPDGHTCMLAFNGCQNFVSSYSLIFYLQLISSNLYLSVYM